MLYHHKIYLIDNNCKQYAVMQISVWNSFKNSFKQNNHDIQDASAKIIDMNKIEERLTIEVTQMTLVLTN